MRRAFLIGFFLIATVLTAGIQAPLRPAAIALRPSGGILLLDPLRGVVEISPQTQAVRTILKDFGSYRAMDFTTARIGSVDYLFISLVLRAEAGVAKVTQFTTSGRAVADRGMPPDVLSVGIVIDPRRQLAYIANARAPEIYTIDLRQPRAFPRLFARVRGAGGLGPLALDERRQQLLVGDVIHGAVHSVDIASRRAKTLARVSGEPSALAVDTGANHLYVADATGSLQVIRLDVSSPKATRLPVRGLREPRGVAAARDGTIWLGDADARALFAVSSSGTVLRTLYPFSAGIPVQKMQRPGD